MGRIADIFGLVWRNISQIDVTLTLYRCKWTTFSPNVWGRLSSYQRNLKCQKV